MGILPRRTNRFLRLAFSLPSTHTDHTAVIGAAACAHRSPALQPGSGAVWLAPSAKRARRLPKTRPGYLIQQTRALPSQARAAEERAGGVGGNAGRIPHQQPATFARKTTQTASRRRVSHQLWGTGLTTATLFKGEDQGKRTRKRVLLCLLSELPGPGKQQSQRNRAQQAQAHLMQCNARPRAP